ncbi:unnamed protein product [Darwinula stevensoni]|uniref:Aquaporin n=1 Tax=Darwinula stevensoni TaxID=69355 RepID=A0A7R9FSZ7_9CRUS|nr:unnamed protein product [Darwinula stevensoni]CAG0904146.1 unnamed protein product [Darwinula stevensoni]
MRSSKFFREFAKLLTRLGPHRSSKADKVTWVLSPRVDVEWAPRRVDGRGAHSHQSLWLLLPPSHVCSMPTMNLKKLVISSQAIRETLAEFLGTFILMLMANGCAAQVILSKDSYGNFFTINVASGIAVAFGVMASGGISGGHINPAVTLGFAAIGKCPWRKLPHYWLGQYLGAFAASVLLYGIYSDALDFYDGGNRTVEGKLATAGLFAAYPNPNGFLSTGIGFLDSLVGTAMLLLLACAVIDERNMQVSKALFPMYIGAIVALIGMSLGWNCAYPINPGKDIAARFFTAIAGWSFDVFT